MQFEGYSPELGIPIRNADEYFYAYISEKSEELRNNKHKIYRTEVDSDNFEGIGI